MHRRETAEHTTTRAQRAVAAYLLVGLALLGAWSPSSLGATLVGAAMVFLTAYMVLRLTLVLASRGYRTPEQEPVPDDELPRYTTLHPMYDEANMIPVVVAAMEAVDYPRDRLECLLVLEERDGATVAAARAFDLPDHFRIVVVPAVRPYGKPKACNYALQHATGDLAVIFDAEDRPEPQQLRKAAATFRAAERRGDRLGCVQARLVFDNEQPLRDGEGRTRRDDDGYDVRPTTWTSRLLGNEYAVHFDLVLTGLARLGLPVPLGGTSNHFPVALLREIAFEREQMPTMPDPDDGSVGAWDPWNVTEDAELGGAIAAAGWRTTVLDSHTDEEACLTARAALNQRSRWVKGYAQTSLVLLRHPWRTARAMGPLSYLAFQLQVGGTFVSLALSPVFWGLFGAYLLTGSDRIASLFPGPVYYAGMALLVVGNLALLTVSLYAAESRGRHGTVRHLLTVLPVWWCLLSLATYVAALELLVPSWRPSWNKTAHGVRHLGMGRRLALASATWFAAPEPTPVRSVAKPAVRFLPPDRTAPVLATGYVAPGVVAPRMPARPARPVPRPVRGGARPVVREVPKAPVRRAAPENYGTLGFASPEP
ncbi:MAG: glycosyltransferase, partial [Nocardioides sp.]